MTPAPATAPPARTEVLVVGAGPAGLALGAALAEAGRDTTVLDPAPLAPWPANYGLWVDEAEALGVPLAARWGRPLVQGDGWTLALGPAYGQVDGSALQAALRDRLLAAGGRLAAGRVAGAEHDESGSTVILADAPPVRARVVVDTSGHRPVLVQRAGPEPSAWQTAYGVEARVEAHPWQPGEMALMDFRQAPLGSVEGPPTFLYAMPLGPDRVFLEETALAARPGLDFPALQERLRRRLAHDGIVIREVLAEERCAIPMDAPLPLRPQRVVALGGAASQVHPATGYSLRSSLQRAPELAALLARGLAGDEAPEVLAERAWQQQWPEERLGLWQVLGFGRETLLELDGDAIQRFFRAFFATPEPAWRPYMAGELSPRQAGALMLQMMGRAPMDLRLRLTRAGLSRGGLGAMVAMLGNS